MFFFESLDVLLSDELEIHSNTLRKAYQKFKVHIFAYLDFRAYFIIYEDPI